MGIVTEEDLLCSTFTWFKERTDVKMPLGICFMDFRLVAMNPFFDDRNVSRKLLDFVVYHEILHLRQNRLRKSSEHDKTFYRWEHEYPYWWLAHFEYQTLTGRILCSDQNVEIENVQSEIISV